MYRTCTWLERFGVLPEPGGLAEQDRAWVEDAELYFSAKAQVQRDYQTWKDENPTT